MASEITPGQKVLVLAEANAVEPQMVTVTPSGYRFTGRAWRAHVDPKCCVPLDDLREVLAWAGDLAATELLTQDVSLDAREAHERLWVSRRDQADALLARLGEAG